MEYHEAVNALIDLRRYNIGRGTSSTRDLLSFVDDPHENVTAVSITGSNGKGSTAMMTAEILRASDFDVGLFISPHLEDVRESVQINGQLATEQSFTRFMDLVDPYIEAQAATGNAPTFFETLTVFAMWEFDRRDVDVAVLEVGLGGDEDATSVVEPVATALTSVSLDHTDILGDTIEEIARTKASIAPPETTLVTGATSAALSTIHEVAEDVVTVGDTEQEDFAVDQRRTGQVESTVSIRGPEWEIETTIGLLGPHQARNAGVAAALASITFDVSTRAIERGLRFARWPGRCEVIQQAPLVVLDGAHNTAGCEQLATVVDRFEYDELLLVFGAACVKDHPPMVRALPTPDEVFTCRPELQALEDESVLATVFENELDVSVQPKPSVADGVATALDRAGPDDLVLITGSLYVVKEARMQWSRTTIPKDGTDVPLTRSTISDVTSADISVDRLVPKSAHHVLKTTVLPGQASVVRNEFELLGGVCSVSGVIHADHEVVDVLLAGTPEQFERLAATLESSHDGFFRLPDDIRRPLASIDSDDDPGRFPCEGRTAVMGVINTSPDSFYQGGVYEQVDQARREAVSMVNAGADIIDLGGETNRPGSEPISVEEELDRVVPFVEALADEDAYLSIDTKKPAVARAAIAAGADIINDVTGLADPAMRKVIASAGVPVVAMHSINAHVDPAATIEYSNVVEDVIDELQERILLAERAGIDRENIILDPGLGFGKTSAEDFELVRRLSEFRALGCPVLIGHSRKSMFDSFPRAADDRLPATIACSALAANRGASIVRVHDVAANVDAVRVSDRLERRTD